MRGRSGLAGAAAAAAMLAASMGALGTAASDASNSLREFKSASAKAKGVSEKATPQRSFSLRSMHGLGSYWGTPPRPGRPLAHSGWTNRSYQRAAKKRRNVARNRRAHRG